MLALIAVNPTHASRVGSGSPPYDYPQRGRYLT
jgi:hypothetical protein